MTHEGIGGQFHEGFQIAGAVGAVANLIEANRDASHGLRMMAEILEDLPIAAELREKAEMRDGFASKLAVLMAKYGKADEIPEGISFKGTRFGWRLQIASALQKDDRAAVLRVAARGNEDMQKEYGKALDAGLPDDVRNVVLRQLREIKATGEWVAEEQ